MIQKNIFMYSIIGTIVSLVINGIITLINKINGKKNIKLWIKVLNFFLIFCLTMILIALSAMFPYKNDSNQEMTEELLSTDLPVTVDGKLRLVFLDGRFAYHVDGSEFLDEYDIVTKRTYAYLDAPILPKATIMIYDREGKLIHSGESDYSESYLVDMQYGTYTMVISAESYKNYEIMFSLTPDNQFDGVWKHDVFLVPNEYQAKDLRIQVVDENEIPYTNCKIEIGMSDRILIEDTDEQGCTVDLFTISKGIYKVSIEGLDLNGEFIIDETVSDKEILQVIMRNQSRVNEIIY